MPVTQAWAVPAPWFGTFAAVSAHELSRGRRGWSLLVLLLFAWALISPATARAGEDEEPGAFEQAVDAGFGFVVNGLNAVLFYPLFDAEASHSAAGVADEPAEVEALLAEIEAGGFEIEHASFVLTLPADQVSEEQAEAIQAQVGLAIVPTIPKGTRTFTVERPVAGAGRDLLHRADGLHQHPRLPSRDRRGPRHLRQPRRRGRGLPLSGPRLRALGHGRAGQHRGRRPGRGHGRSGGGLLDDPRRLLGHVLEVRRVHPRAGLPQAPPRRPRARRADELPRRGPGDDGLRQACARSSRCSTSCRGSTAS